MRRTKSLGFDRATVRKGVGGGSPLQWVSYGTVDPDTPGLRSVDLEGEDGGLPYGPMVSVTLQPSGLSVPCRVSSMLAGDGEAEWYPFVAGDEVLVALPEGHERAGAVIIGRLNQTLDQWPKTVAGQDATKNTFGFRRMRAPFVVESGGGFLIRSATTGAQLGLDSTGQVIINDGDKNAFIAGPEAVGFQNGEQDTFVHVFPSAKQVYLGADATTFLLDGSASKFISSGTLSFATSGGIPTGTAVTAEQVVAIIINVLAQLATTSCFSPASPMGLAYSAGGPASAIAAILAVMTPVLAAMATPAPFTGVPAGNFAVFVPAIFGPVGAIAAAEANPLAAVDVTGTTPGYGRAGFQL